MNNEERNQLKFDLAGHSLEHLFIEQLGWDRVLTNSFIFADNSMVLAIAQKRGFMDFACEMHCTDLANRSLLRRHQRELRKQYHEHILIHYCETPRNQVWQWVTSVGDDAIEKG